MMHHDTSSENTPNLLKERNLKLFDTLYLKSKQFIADDDNDTIFEENSKNRKRNVMSVKLAKNYSLEKQNIV